MFAILETGSKQYIVEEGDVLEVELLEKEKISEDNKIDFDSVLLVKDQDVLIGQPFVKDARITASVLEEFKAPKVIVFKKKSKKQYKRKRGHRQQLHRIKIEKIAVGSGGSSSTNTEKTAETGAAEESENQKEKE
jgi:large subunit ribosomal protein L21